MKYALITGASGGIGAATARAFAQAGYGVALHGFRHPDRLHALAQELSQHNVPVLEVCADLSDPAQAKSMVDNVLEKFCQLDILICCSGLSHVGLISDIDQENWRRLFGVNVDGMHFCCQAVLPHMIHRKEGCIITVSSMWGQVGASCEVAYSAAKAGVIGLTKALHRSRGHCHRNERPFVLPGPGRAGRRDPPGPHRQPPGVRRLRTLSGLRRGLLCDRSGACPQRRIGGLNRVSVTMLHNDRPPRTVIVYFSG